MCTHNQKEKENKRKSQSIEQIQGRKCGAQSVWDKFELAFSYVEARNML